MHPGTPTMSITGRLAGWKKPHPFFLQTVELEKGKFGSLDFPQPEMENLVMSVGFFQMGLTND